MDGTQGWRVRSAWMAAIPQRPWTSEDDPNPSFCGTERAKYPRVAAGVRHGPALGSHRLWRLTLSTSAPIPVSASEEQAAMSQKLAGKAFVSVALIAMVRLPAMAQAPLAPPPQIPYGVSVSTESAKNVAAA